MRTFIYRKRRVNLAISKLVDSMNREELSKLLLLVDEDILRQIAKQAMRMILLKKENRG